MLWNWRLLVISRRIAIIATVGHPMHQSMCCLSARIIQSSAKKMLLVYCCSLLSTLQSSFPATNFRTNPLDIVLPTKMCRETFGMYHECGHIKERDFLYCYNATTTGEMGVYAQGPNQLVVCSRLGNPDYYITNPPRCEGCEELRRQAFERLARADPSYKGDSQPCAIGVPGYESAWHC